MAKRSIRGGAYALILAGFVAACPAAAQPQVPAAGAKVLQVGTKQAAPFAIKADDGSWSGISIDLWRHVAERLHLKYELREATLDGLISGTASGSFDAAVSAITVTAARERVLDFTQPFYSTGLGIAVPRATIFDWWKLVRSLLSAGFFEALIGLVGVTLAIGVMVWLLERQQTEHFRGGRTGLVSSVWWSALTMAQAGAEQEPKTPFGRIVAVAWMATSVMVVAVFTAGITAQLTAKQLQGAVHEVDDLRSVRVGAVNGTASLDYLTRERIHFRGYPMLQDGLEALRAGTLDALVYDRPLMAWLAKEAFSNSVTVLDVTFDRQSYAIALPNDSPLRVPINLVMLETMQSDQWRDSIFKYLGKE